MEKVQETHLYKCLKERDSKFISQLDEVIKYAETMLPLINNVFASYTIHGIQPVSYTHLTLPTKA